MADREATRRTGEAIVVSCSPDVCKTPVGSSMVPVAYQIVSDFDKSVDTALTVNFAGNPAFHAQSYLSTVVGNEAGVGGGVVSGVNKGTCRPSKWSSTVRVEGNYIIRHDELFLMNCQGPEGSSNTTGKVVYIRIVQMAKVNEDGTITVEKKGAGEDSEGNLLEFESIETLDSEGNVIDGKYQIDQTDAMSRLSESKDGFLPEPESGEFGSGFCVPEPGTSSETGNGLLPVGRESNGFDPEPITAEPAPSPELGEPALWDNSPSALQDTNPPVVPETQAEKGWWDTASPWVHSGLDVAGFVPVVGDVVGDGGNAILYAIEGNWLDAGLSAGAMIPFAGMISTAGKWAKRGAKYLPDIVKKAEKAVDAVKKFGKKAKDKASKLAKESVDKLKNKWNDFWKKKKTDAPGPKKKKPGGDKGDSGGKDGGKITQLPPKPKLRLQYEKEVKSLKDKGEKLRAQGKSPEEIARQLHEDRRALGVKYKNLTPDKLREEIYAMNLEKYGDPLGPTVDYLRNVKGKSWDQIIESSANPGGWKRLCDFLSSKGYDPNTYFKRFE